jgi:PhnB protein
MMHVPEGFAVVTPYIFVDGAQEYVRFLEAAFGAREIGRSTAPDGGSSTASSDFLQRPSW